MRSCAQQWGLATLLLGLFGSLANAAQFPYQNTSLPIDQRVAGRQTGRNGVRGTGRKRQERGGLLRIIIIWPRSVTLYERMVVERH